MELSWHEKKIIIIANVLAGKDTLLEGESIWHELTGILLVQRYNKFQALIHQVYIWLFAKEGERRGASGRQCMVMTTILIRVVAVLDSDPRSDSPQQ